MKKLLLASLLLCWGSHFTVGQPAPAGGAAITISGGGGNLTPPGSTSGVVSYTAVATGIPGTVLAGGTCPFSGTVVSDVNVPSILGYNTEITNITLFGIQHTFAADLDLRLISPNGVVYTFNLDNGGSTGLDVMTDMCFDVTAASCADLWTSSTSAAQPINCLQFETVENTCGPLDATFTFTCGPNTGQIDGDEVNGTWTLEITDDAGGDTGSFTSFSITFASTSPPANDSNGTPVDLLACCVCVPTSGTDIQTAFNSYTWIDGNTYTTSNNSATFTLTNAEGCDSVVTLDLTINYGGTGTGGALTPPGTTSGVVSYTADILGVPGTTLTGGTCGATGNVIADVSVPAILGYNAEITNITLYDVQHTFAADLDLRLISPNGVIYTFNLDNGGSTGLDVMTDMCFDVTAANCADSWTSSTSAAQPEDCLQFETSENNCGPLDASFAFVCSVDNGQIDGDEVNGTWTLEITDDAGGDTGSFGSFSITVGTTTPPANDSNGTPIDLLTCCCTPTSGTDTQVACDSYDWIDGITYTASNNSATFTLVNAAGCDSIVTLDLTMGFSNTGTDTQTAFNSYTWIDGNTYTESNNSATFTVTNASGCDSVVTLDLTINYGGTGTGGDLTPPGTTSGVVSYTADILGVPGTTLTGGTCGATGNVIADVSVPAILGYNAEITNITLFDVQHTWASDLDLRLISPNGVIYTFNLDNGGSTGLDVMTDMCFDISAIDCADDWTSSTSTAQPASCLQFETAENVCGPLDASFSFVCSVDNGQIDGDEVNGTWTLEITDDTGGDTGSFGSFSITVGLTTPPATDSNGTPIDLLACCCTPTSGTDTQVACDSYDWIDGNTYTASNNSATFTLVNAAGCDSIVTLDLTMGFSNTGTDTQVACERFDWIDGNTYTASNNSATFTVTNTAGCDSVVTLDLTIINVDVTTTTADPTITANAGGTATYRWLDCDDNDAVIIGETAQSFTALVNGNFAVEVTQDGCVDTSACVAILTVGIVESNLSGELSLYPNPTQGNVSIDLGGVYEGVTLNLFSVEGKLLETVQYNQAQRFDYTVNQAAGMYLLSITADNKTAVVRVVKQ